MSLRALTDATSLLFSFYALVLGVIAPGVMTTSDIFHAARNYRTGVTSHVVRIGDFNSDGNLELAMAREAGLAVLNGAVDLVTIGQETRFVSVQLNLRGTFLHTTGSVHPSKFGQTARLTTTVNASLGGFAIPTGGVNFKDSTTVLGASALNAGKTSLTTSTLGVGPIRSGRLTPATASSMHMKCSPSGKRCSKPSLAQIS